MRHLILTGFLTALLLLSGCVPLMVGGLVGYTVAQDKAAGDKQHQEKLAVEKAKLEELQKQTMAEAARGR